VGAAVFVDALVFICRKPVWGIGLIFFAAESLSRRRSLRASGLVFVYRQAEETGNAGELLAEYGAQIAQVVRGETVPLSSGEQSEILRAAISYCPNDLAVAGWNAAFVFDTVPGALATIEMLEYANSQLLEFRYYDEVLTQQMDSAYDALQKGVGLWARWPSLKFRAASTLCLELAERTDNSMKFPSDMYSARLYQLAASKVGGPGL